MEEEQEEDSDLEERNRRHLVIMDISVDQLMDNSGFSLIGG